MPIRCRYMMEAARKWKCRDKKRLKLPLNGTFSDLNFAQECETNCGSEMADCIVACGESAECVSFCYRDQVVCIDSCPCHAGNDCEV